MTKLVLVATTVALLVASAISAAAQGLNQFPGIRPL